MISSKFKMAITVWLIIISIISIAALCRTFYRNVYLGFDYSGILVGVLAALCTVLIGWQIYVLVDVRNIDDKFKAFECKRNEDNLRTALQIYESVSTLTTQLATNATKEELLPQSIMFDLLCIITHSKLEQFDICSAEIRNLIQVPTTNIHVKPCNKNFYIRILSEMYCPDKIKEYPDLVSWITTLSVHPNL